MTFQIKLRDQNGYIAISGQRIGIAKKKIENPEGNKAPKRQCSGVDRVPEHTGVEDQDSTEAFSLNHSTPFKVSGSENKINP